MKKARFILVLFTILLIFVSFSVIVSAESDQSPDNLLDYAGIPAVALIIGIAEAIKRLSVINVKFIPLINIGLGILAGILITKDITQGVFIGIAVGLSASGLYSSSKNIIQGINKKD